MWRQQNDSRACQSCWWRARELVTHFLKPTTTIEIEMVGPQFRLPAPAPSTSTRHDKLAAARWGRICISASQPAGDRDADRQTQLPSGAARAQVKPRFWRRHASAMINLLWLAAAMNEIRDQQLFATIVRPSLANNNQTMPRSAGAAARTTLIVIVISRLIALAAN